MTWRALRLPAVLELTGLGRSTIYAMVDKERFPPPIRLGRRAVAWSEAEVVEWMEIRKAERGVA